MSQTKNSPLLYNPAMQSDDEIIANFVIRLDEFRDLFDELKKNKMIHPPQHYTILAQRGYGKTTLLLRLRIEVEKDPELNNWLMPVMFDEEQYGIFNLAKFWEEIIFRISDNPVFYELSEQAEQANDEEELFNLLTEALENNNKKLLLLIDNFGDLLNKFSKKEVQRLREIFLTSPNIRLIGASSVMLELFYEHKEPFFNFFKTITLNELSERDTIVLLKKLAETYPSNEAEDIINNQPQRIEALRRLTGGVPRTIILLFEIFTDDDNGSSISDLEKVLDSVTPLYKHRLDNLSNQQQVIVDAVAQAWDAVSTGEIASVTGLEPKKISAQLNLLEKSQLIKKIQTSTKNNLYQLNERFFNIYYLMRAGRKKSRKKVIWLTRFFEMWCDEKTLKERVLKHIAALKENKLSDKHTFYIGQALASAPIDMELQHKLLSESRKNLELKNSSYCKELIPSHIEILNTVENKLRNNDLKSAAKILSEDGIESSAVSFIIGNTFYEKLHNKAKAKEYYEKAIEKGHVDAINNLAVLYANEYKDKEKAKEYYELAIEKGVVGAIYNLALLYANEYKDKEKAKEYYALAIEKGHVDAINNLAVLYANEYKDKEKAKEYYERAIEKGHVGAIYNLAMLYQTEYKDKAKAKEYYEKAIEKGIVEAINNLAVLYQTEYKDKAKAKEYYEKAIEKGIVEAIFSLAVLYADEYKDKAKAKEYYELAIEKGHVDAIFNLALLYAEEYKDKAKAKEYYEKAIEKGIVEAIFSLAVLYADEYKDKAKAKEYYELAIEKGHVDAINNLALLYAEEYKDKEKAKEYYELAIEKGDVDAIFNLAILYQTEYKDKEKAKEYYQLAIEKGVPMAMNNLAYIYYEDNINKEEALRLITRATSKDSNYTWSLTLIVILLWNNETDEAIKEYKNLVFTEENINDYIPDLKEAILMFIANGQYNFVYSVFKENKNNILDRLKPVYYALLSFMGKEYNDEYLRMGDELKQTVEEIKAEITRLENKYFPA